ncbi:uncharacterized protein A4U43_C04F28350 [Asparagus officinalis]|uniref:RPA-interacting protein C-terminal domain-containing protein n=1 Tax=Asparagus officinalis TaxID=4686 RepID=A0A5P1F4U8_ASPOF|nr:uncharacterized protein LOC109838013 [Asparagus officinalis]ONK73202.1 uncharacterized protein A4U43_C04F28350 [Asparagus officinalis]
MVPEKGNRPTRESLKSHHTTWKDKLRQNCLRRIREERARLLWKIRSNEPTADKKVIVGSAFRDILSDELQKIKQPPSRDCQETSMSKDVDFLWEYDGPNADNSVEIESEDILIEMERLLYEELREEMIKRELEAYEEEEDYLARAVFEQIQLDNKQVISKNDKVWCPICKQGELREAYHFIYCTSCNLRLDLENDKVNLDFLRDRLGEVHVEHLERGCKVMPKFCMETVFDLTALYIQCKICDTFEIVI